MGLNDLRILFFLSKQGKPERKETVGGEDTTKLSRRLSLTSADWCDQWVDSAFPAVGL